MHLLLATSNAHKADEVRAILSGTRIEVRTLLDRPDLPDAPETGATFVANALQKALFIHERTGQPVIADDSGLEVDALGGAPGVHSRRYSAEATHEANNALLLHSLGGNPNRVAHFRCVLALVTPTFKGTVEGVCLGTIATEARGRHGFGYDPLFIPHELGGRAMAEATMVEKNAISHRGRAFRQLPALLAAAGLL